MAAFCWNCFQELEAPGPCPHCGYVPADQERDYPLALRPGSVLHERYLVGRVLGQGGFGITYLAQDFGAKRRTAIKEYMPSELAGRLPESPVLQIHSDSQREYFAFGKQRFLDEVRTLAELSGDSHIVRIHSYFEENGTAYFVMDYVDGPPLDAYLRALGRRLTSAEVNALLLPLMESLARVHEKGIVHRDVTPDNILIENGSAKLIDFGAARQSTGEKTKSMDIVLKHGFAPYEQYMRRGRQGPFTDVYSLAATYYYAITGKVPPEATSRMERDELIPPRELGADISPEQEAALLKGLAVMAADRWQTMAEFSAALQSADAGAEGGARKKRLPPLFAGASKKLPATETDGAAPLPAKSAPQRRMLRLIALALLLVLLVSGGLLLRAAVPGTTPWVEPVSGPEDPELPRLSLFGATYPSRLKKGSHVVLKGRIETDKGILEAVRGFILDAEGESVQSCEFYPGTQSLNLMSSLNEYLLFGQLEPGQYRYLVTASAVNGDSATGEVTLIDQPFEIYL